MSDGGERNPDDGDRDGDRNGSDNDRDPFDALDDDFRDRAGNPFDRLSRRPSDDSDGSEDGNARADPFEYPGDDALESPKGRDTDPAGGDDERRDVDVAAGDPFSDVEVSREDPFESEASAFDRVGVEGADADEVWDRLTEEPETGPDSAALRDGASDVVEVSKHGFCENCEHFSAPPNVDCTHEGTDILEFTGVDTVRVANCPVVAQRRELGGLDE